MSLATATITYDISDMVGADFDPRRTKIWVTTNVEGGAVIDTDGAQIRLGDGLGTLSEDGTGSVQVWVPSDESNPMSWQTYINVDHSDRRPAGVGGKREVRTFGPFTITGDADLAYLVAEQEVPPTYLSQVTAQLQTYVDAAAASAAEAHDISNIDTSDDVVSLLIEDPSSDTTTALLTAVGRGISDDPTYTGSLIDATYEVASAVVAPFAARKFDRPMVEARDFPGASGIPSTNTGLATVSAATGSSGITSSTVFQPSTAYFRPIGAVPVYGATFPNSLGWVAPTYGKTSAPPWGIEFNLDTTDGLFEIYAKGTGAAFRVLVNGQYVAAPTVLANDGGAYWTKVAITAGAGTYRIGIEATSTMVLYGIVAIASTAFAPAVRRGPRYAALGDSFWEPTISETGLTAGTSSLYGQPTILRYVTGLDVFAMGSGGTGLVNPGSGGRVKYRGRIAEVTGLPDLDGVIVCMSGNDQSYTAAQVLTEAQGVVSDLLAAGLTRPGQIVFFSSWWSGAGATIPSSLLEQLDVVKAWCATQSIPFVDILTPPGVTGTATTLTSTATAGATSVIVGTSIPIGRWIKIGPAGSAVLRKITNLTGSGPYTLTFSGVTTTTYSSGAPVLEVGESDLNTGTVSRFTGPDTTHPTRAGAENRAKRFAARWASVIPR